ncbi:hypothetical protein CIPAW_05G004300 [Carya illinoinensis]|uniref:Uncharacterized protein n=1 Tax=Carya illinoinensis TaxID=32201 RepID=A0A8T1QDS3_CARIL|nr:hypothetical protein CIPAW_05G004300 [Carya illinoinensis]KAG6652403.1 hypothetical protein CIPAW_05G004300 [Carya illinoinensis]
MLRSIEDIYGLCTRNMKCFLDENDVSFQMLRTCSFGVVQDELSYHSFSDMVIALLNKEFYSIHFRLF